MKKYVLLVIVSVMVLAILTACGKTPAAQAPVVETTEATVAVPVTEPAPTETEEMEYEGDASSYYIDVAYREQIARYYTALSE